MAETGIYLCDADLLEVSDELFSAGGVLVPDEEYETAEYTQITTRTELERVLRARPHLVLFFAVSPAWQRAPLEMKSMVKHGRTIFYHVQQNGGPTLDIFYPRPFQADHGLQLRPGFLAHHAKFWNPNTGEMELAPPALADLYKQLRARFAKGGRRVQEGKRTFIVTKNADGLGAILRAE
jgi:hypothetical protein